MMHHFDYINKKIVVPIFGSFDRVAGLLTLKLF